MKHPSDMQEMAAMLADLQLFAQREAMTELSEALADARLYLAMERKFLDAARDSSPATGPVETGDSNRS